jgi:hypothetical protein
MPDYPEIRRKIGELSNLRDLKTDQLKDYEKWFAGQSFGSGSEAQQYQQLCLAQLTLIQNELQHRETFGIDTKALKNSECTLRWAIVAGVTGLLILIAEYVPLIRDTFFSTTQPASAPKATPATPLQSQSTTTVSPELGVSSNNATPSPEPTVTPQPSVTPPESL